MTWLNQNDLHLPWCLPFIISHFNESSFLCFAYRRKAMMSLSEQNEKLYASSCYLFSIAWYCIKINIDKITFLRVIFLPNLLYYCLWLGVKFLKKQKSNHLSIHGALLQSWRLYSAAFPKSLSGSWIRSITAGTWTGTYVGCQHHR